MTVRPRWALVATVVALVPGVQMGLARGSALALAALGSWGVAAVVRAFARRELPAARAQARVDLVSALVLCAVAAFATVLGLVPAPAARTTTAALLVTGAAAAVLRALGPRPSAVRRVALVGTQSDIENYGATGSSRDVVTSCYVVGAPACAVQSSLLVPTTTDIDTLPELVEKVRAEAVLVLPGPHVDCSVVRRLTWMFEHTPVTIGVVAPVSSVAARRLRTRTTDGCAIIEVGAPRPGVVSRLVKDVVDRLAAAVLLVLCAPLLLVMWLAVRMDSKGPGFFVQTRVGRDGLPFQMVKMRTMHVNAEAVLTNLLENNEALGGVLFKIRRDPRITRVGSWLRRSSLDELPQLFNVLRGEMALVGPRPALPSEVAMYDDVARRRLVVKPGITGLWQVSGRSDLRWDEAIKLDLYYADNWGLLDDAAIAVRTLRAVTAARGAY
jgi:exopolysaccharide biosynthesis polyprenyl glycosylphosphotransferase